MGIHLGFILNHIKLHWLRHEIGHYDDNLRIVKMPFCAINGCCMPRLWVEYNFHLGGAGGGGQGNAQGHLELCKDLKNLNIQMWLVLSPNEELGLEAWLIIVFISLY